MACDLIWLGKLVAHIGQTMKKTLKLDTIKDLGFQGLLYVKTMFVYENLCIWLCDQYDIDYTTLNVHGITIKVGLLEVTTILGLCNNEKWANIDK